MSDRSLKQSDDAIVDLIELMRRLRDPQSGCPWDIEQTYATIAPYTIEEAYEVDDAIARGDLNDLKEELGDLLLQVVFHSQIATDEGHFTIQDVARAIVDKMVRRHPHVFGDAQIATADAQTSAWEVMKAAERANKTTSADAVASALDGVAFSLPALMRAEKLLKRAARVGFDWPRSQDVVAKLHEELAEIEGAVKAADPMAIEEEVGDLLLVAANLARKHGVDPEIALKKANQKFEKRFRAMEEISRSKGEAFSDQSLDDMLALWHRVKDDQEDV